MRNKKKNVSLSDFIFKPTVDSIFSIRWEPSKKQKGLIDFKVLILIALLILILLIFFL